MLPLVPDAPFNLTWRRTDSSIENYELRCHQLHFATLSFRASSFRASAHSAHESWFLSPSGIFRRRISIGSGSAKPDIAQYRESRDRGDLRFSYGEALILRFNNGRQSGCRILDQDYLALVRLVSRDVASNEVEVSVSQLAWSRSDLGLLLVTGLYCLLLRRHRRVLTRTITCAYARDSVWRTWKRWVPRLG